MLEQSFRLRDLGVFGFGPLFVYSTKDNLVHFCGEMPYYRTCVPSWLKVAVPAWTAGELGIMLPEHCYTQFHANVDLIKAHPNHEAPHWEATFCFGNRKKSDRHFKDEQYHIFGHTEAQARASLLIYALEVAFTSAAEVNERLKQA